MCSRLKPITLLKSKTLETECFNKKKRSSARKCVQYTQRKSLRNQGGVLIGQQHTLVFPCDGRVEVLENLPAALPSIVVLVH